MLSQEWNCEVSEIYKDSTRGKTKGVKDDRIQYKKIYIREEDSSSAGESSPNLPFIPRASETPDLKWA